MSHDPAQLVGSASLAFLEKVESSPFPLTLLDKAQAYTVCALVEAYHGNTAGANGILHWFEDHLEETEESIPADVIRLINRTRARVASTTASKRAARPAPDESIPDPMDKQRTRFTLSGLTRRHR